MLHNALPKEPFNALIQQIFCHICSLCSKFSVCSASVYNVFLCARATCKSRLSSLYNIKVQHHTLHTICAPQQKYIEQTHDSQLIICELARGSINARNILATEHISGFAKPRRNRKFLKRNLKYEYTHYTGYSQLARARNPFASKYCKAEKKNYLKTKYYSLYDATFVLSFVVIISCSDTQTPCRAHICIKHACILGNWNNFLHILPIDASTRRSMYARLLICTLKGVLKNFLS